VDPFDLPDWLGTEQVTWRASADLRTGHHVGGEFLGRGCGTLGADLYAVDEACPVPVAPDDLRQTAHRSWRRGEVALVDLDGRLALTIPGRGFDCDTVVDAVRRFARAVGADPASYAVLLRVG